MIKLVFHFLLHDNLQRRDPGQPTITRTVVQHVPRPTKLSDPLMLLTQLSSLNPSLERAIPQGALLCSDYRKGGWRSRHMAVAIFVTLHAYWLHARRTMVRGGHLSRQGTFFQSHKFTPMC